MFGFALHHNIANTNAVVSPWQTSTVLPNHLMASAVSSAEPTDGRFDKFNEQFASFGLSSVGLKLLPKNLLSLDNDTYSHSEKDGVFEWNHFNKCWGSPWFYSEDMKDKPEIILPTKPNQTAEDPKINMVALFTTLYPNYNPDRLKFLSENDNFIKYLYSGSTGVEFHWCKIMQTWILSRQNFPDKEQHCTTPWQTSTILPNHLMASAKEPPATLEPTSEPTHTFTDTELRKHMFEVQFNGKYEFSKLKPFENITLCEQFPRFEFYYIIHDTNVPVHWLGNIDVFTWMPVSKRWSKSA